MGPQVGTRARAQPPPRTPGGLQAPHARLPEPVGGQAIVGTPKSAAGTRLVSIPPHVIPAVPPPRGDGGRDSGRAAIPRPRQRVPPAAVDAAPQLAHGAGGGRTPGPASARPPAHRSHDGGAGGRDPRRATAVAWPRLGLRGAEVPARGPGSRQGDRRRPLGQAAHEGR